MSDERDDTAARPSGKRSSRRARAGSPQDADTGSVATIERDHADEPASKGDKKKPSGKKKTERGGKGNPLKRLVQFLRQVVAELRKVIWPNRKQMLTYTSVVLVFVIFMVAFISGLDLAFIKGVNWLFG